MFKIVILEPPTGDKSCSRCVCLNCDSFCANATLHKKCTFQWFGPACSHLRICWPAFYSRISWILKAQWRANTTKATETFFCDKNARQNARKYLANAWIFFRKACKTRKAAFFLLDGLTRNLKILTQAMWLCHQYAWAQGRILSWRYNGGTQAWLSLSPSDFQQHVFLSQGLPRANVSVWR